MLAEFSWREVIANKKIMLNSLINSQSSMILCDFHVSTQFRVKTR